MSVKDFDPASEKVSDILGTIKKKWDSSVNPAEYGKFLGLLTIIYNDKGELDTALAAIDPVFQLKDPKERVRVFEKLLFMFAKLAHEARAEVNIQ